MCIVFDTENISRGWNVSTLMFCLGNPTIGETFVVGVWHLCGWTVSTWSGGGRKVCLFILRTFYVLHEQYVWIHSFMKFLFIEVTVSRIWSSTIKPKHYMLRDHVHTTIVLCFFHSRRGMFALSLKHLFWSTIAVTVAVRPN